MSNTKISQYKSVRDFKDRIELNYFHIGSMQTRKVYPYSTFAIEVGGVRKCAKEDGFGKLAMVLPLFTKLNLN